MYRVTIVGMNRVTEKLKTIPLHVRKELDAELESSAKRWVQLSKRDAPGDVGFLRNKTSYFKVSDLLFEVVSGALYAGFLEFGTKKKYKPIPGTEDIASQLKGQKGGTIDEFFESIFNWVKRKGLADTFSTGVKKKKGGGFDNSGKKGKRKRASDDQAYDLAFVIMLSILKNGIKAQPYFFKQRVIVEPELFRNVNQILLTVLD